MDGSIKNENNARRVVMRRRPVRDLAAQPTRHDSTDFLFDGKRENGGVFVDSVYGITPDEIGGTVDKKKRQKDIIGYILDKLMLFLAVGVFIYCAVNLVIIFTEQTAGDRYYDDMMAEFSLSLGDTSSSAGASVMAAMKPSEAFVAGVSQPDHGIVIENTVYNEEVELMKAKLSALKNTYPDIYGQIIINDTVINYPVVKGEDNDYYLNHAFTGEPLSIGSVFADYRLNDYILDNYNTVFYAHNSSTGKMFADVMKYAYDEEFFNTHNIYVYTPTGLYVFEPFNLSVFQSNYPYFKTRFSSGAEFVKFANEMQSHSQYKKRAEFDEDDRIITLSTCTKLGIKSLRYCLQAKLIEVIE